MLRQLSLRYIRNGYFDEKISKTGKYSED
jgi:hypothetical protein